MGENGVGRAVARYVASGARAMRWRQAGGPLGPPHPVSLMERGSKNTQSAGHAKGTLLATSSRHRWTISWGAIVREA